MTVARVWAKHRLRPHRLERYMASNDPQFEAKAADIIGLYLNPPQHAAVFCVDEKTAIQALDRKDLVLPLSPGRAERHGFEYYRHGTLSLFAAFNTRTGDVLGKTAQRHTSAEFVAFLLTSWPINPSVKRSTSSPILGPRTMKKTRWLLYRCFLLVFVIELVLLARSFSPTRGIALPSSRVPKKKEG